AELIGHGELTPWSLVLGERWVFIDWDDAAPSTRLWDLAYSAQAFALNDVSEDPPGAALRLAALVDGYGADAELRARLPRTMTMRAAATWTMLRDAHDAGRKPWASMFTTGHRAHWRGVADHVGRHEAVWARARRSVAPGPSSPGMASSSSLLAHPAAGGTALAERETIRAQLLERRPDLERRPLVGPSGAVLIPLAAGRCIEIGRMRRRGAARWVVVTPTADGARLREPSDLDAVARAALGALQEAEARR